MIQSSCPSCGGKVLLPDPPSKTPEEKRAFSQAWDDRVKAGRQ